MRCLYVVSNAVLEKRDVFHDLVVSAAATGLLSPNTDVLRIMCLSDSTTPSRQPNTSQLTKLLLTSKPMNVFKKPQDNLGRFELDASTGHLFHVKDSRHEAMELPTFRFSWEINNNEGKRLCVRFAVLQRLPTGFFREYFCDTVNGCYVAVDTPPNTLLLSRLVKTTDCTSFQLHDFDIDFASNTLSPCAMVECLTVEDMDKQLYAIDIALTAEKKRLDYKRIPLVKLVDHIGSDSHNVLLTVATREDPIGCLKQIADMHEVKLAELADCLGLVVWNTEIAYFDGIASQALRLGLNIGCQLLSFKTPGSAQLITSFLFVVNDSRFLDYWHNRVATEEELCEGLIQDFHFYSIVLLADQGDEQMHSWVWRKIEKCVSCVLKETASAANAVDCDSDF